MLREQVGPSQHARAHHGATRPHTRAGGALQACKCSPRRPRLFPTREQVEPSRVTYDILLRAAWAMSATSRFLELKELIAQVRAADEP
jgi:hypothetical protein